jgi:Flp pilus assembly protein TadG
MLQRTKTSGRRGSILPLVTISLVAIFGFVAMAIDIGMLVVAKTQCQNAADAAAMTGARSLDGTPSGNVPTAMDNARSIAGVNQVLAQNVLATDVSLQAGAFHYDTTNQTFAPQFPPMPPDNYNLMQATVSHTVNYAFARIFNLTSLNVSATAIAAHRPRDVCMVLDYSGSMNNESDLWNCETYLGNMYGTSNNTDSTFPQWGEYEMSWSPLATLQCTSADPRIGKCNVTASILGVPAMVNDFYQNTRGAAAASAFTPGPASVTNTNPGGDPARHRVRHVNDIPGGAPFRGYRATYGQFYGHREGPGYWGKTQGERIKFSHGAGVKSGQFLRQPLFQGFRHA